MDWIELHWLSKMDPRPTLPRTAIAT